MIKNLIKLLFDSVINKLIFQRVVRLFMSLRFQNASKATVAAITNPTALVTAPVSDLSSEAQLSSSQQVRVTSSAINYSEAVKLLVAC